VNFEVSPWSGLLRPAAGSAPAGNWTDAGLLVPDLSVTAAHLGLARTGESSSWFDEYVKQYLTSADYFAPMVAAGSRPILPRSSTASCCCIRARFTSRSLRLSTMPRITRNWPRSTGDGSWPG
jgi:hypothetical protein